MANEIYPVSWWGSPVENGWGGIYYDFAQSGGLDGTSFITTWRTTTTNETITIPTTGGGYNYDISTSDGQTFTGVNGDKTITFANAGDYDISISGTFPRIYINNGVDKDKIIDIKQWGNIAWTSLESAFKGASNLQLTATDAPDLSNLTTLKEIFRQCTIFNANINHWDVSNVTNLDSVFYFASSFNQPLNNWDVSNVTTMSSSFRRSAFNQDLSSWNTSSVTNFINTFRESSYNGSGSSNWDVSNVTGVDRMFYQTPFNENISGWDIIGITSFTDFLKNSSALSTANYDAILIGWEATLQAAFPNGSGYAPSISINFGNSEYTGGGAAEASRTSLINNFNWTITDGGIA